MVWSNQKSATSMGTEEDVESDSLVPGKYKQKKTIAEQNKTSPVQQGLGLAKTAYDVGKNIVNAATPTVAEYSGVGSVNAPQSAASEALPNTIGGGGIINAPASAATDFVTVPGATEALGEVGEQSLTPAVETAGEATTAAAPGLVSSVVSTAAPYVALHGIRKLGDEGVGNIINQYNLKNPTGMGHDFAAQEAQVASEHANLEDLPYQHLKAEMPSTFNNWESDVGSQIVNPVKGVLEGIGSLLGKKGGGSCIIITACTNSDSYEVNVAREYRDKFLSIAQRRGYYYLADKAVPYLKSSEKYRNFVKKWLVDSLIDYGEYRLDQKKERSSVTSYLISKIFLITINLLGIIFRNYVRANGEEI
jgi:hypothetical protein